MKLSLEIKKKISLQIVIFLKKKKKKKKYGGGGRNLPPPCWILREKVPLFNRLV